MRQVSQEVKLMLLLWAVVQPSHWGGSIMRIHGWHCRMVAMGGFLAQERLHGEGKVASPTAAAASQASLAELQTVTAAAQQATKTTLMALAGADPQLLAMKAEMESSKRLQVHFAAKGLESILEQP